MTRSQQERSRRAKMVAQGIATILTAGGALDVEVIESGNDPLGWTVDVPFDGTTNLVGLNIEVIPHYEDGDENV